jgi:hypothetical protein
MSEGKEMRKEITERLNNLGYNVDIEMLEENSDGNSMMIITNNDNGKESIYYDYHKSNADKIVEYYWENN